MQVRKLTAYVLRVPLRRPFRHASAVRHYSDNIVVRAELADGTFGWGEGVPRDYVTGETSAGALQQFAATRVSEQLAGSPQNWQEIIILCERFQPATMRDDPRACYGNSLRSAVELSLLDAYGKTLGEPLSRMIEHFGPAADIRYRQSSVRYSTTIDAEHARRLWRSALKMRLYGFKHCKVKVGADRQADAARMNIVRRWIGPNVDLRIDANEAWRPESMVQHLEALTPYAVSCVEQPLPHEEIGALRELRHQTDVPIMLDESLTSLVDASEAVRLDACDLFNIRISKCGGLLNSLRLAAFAHDHGIGYQLGCHPGETGILSAAGRHFATSVGGISYLEGSYDRHVLGKPLTTPDLTFDYGGRAYPLRVPGLGATLKMRVAKRFLRDSQEIVIDQ